MLLQVLRCDTVVAVSLWFCHVDYVNTVAHCSVSVYGLQTNSSTIATTCIKENNGT